jgi:CHAD domain-containing protein
VALALARGADGPTQLLRDRVRRLFRFLPKALNADEEALHQLRVSGRRLRVALPMLATKPEGKRARRALKILRQVTRTAGASRDHDVMVGLMDESLKAAPAPTPAARLLRRRLLGARGRSRRRMTDGLLDLEIATVRRDLRRLVARRGEAFFTVLVRVRRARDSEGDEAVTILLRLGDAFLPEDLHKLRIVVRRLRYLAELLDALRGQKSGAAGLLKQLQDLLGSIRDRWLLAEWARSQATRGGPRDTVALRRAAAALQATFTAESQAHHRAWLAAPPREILQRALRAMGGRTQVA